MELPSSSWVRSVSDFWVNWISWSQVFRKMAESKMAEFKMAEYNMAAIINDKWEWMSLSQIELVWVRVQAEEECFWVNLREDDRVSESKMAVF